MSGVISALHITTALKKIPYAVALRFITYCGMNGVSWALHAFNSRVHEQRIVHALLEGQ